MAIARLFGIEIRVSVAWAVLAAILTMLGAEQAAITSPALAVPLQWVVGGLVALGFLVSVVAHELAHSLVGRRLGVASTVIVLGFIGGIAPHSIQARRPSDELAIALAGPGLSLGLALVVLPIGLVVALSGAGLGAVAGGLLLIGVLNLFLGLVSLLPGMPLDGGRVVRALAWAHSGNQDRAGRLAARVGRLVGWTTIGIGLAMAIANLVTPGILVLSLGWLIGTGSKTMDRRLDLEILLRGATVGEAMLSDGPRVAPHLTVDTFADRFSGPDAVSALPVVEDGRVLGVIGKKRLQRLGRRRLGATRAEDVMVVPPQAPILAPGDPLWDVVDTLNASGLDGLAVVDGGLFAGMITREAIAVVMRQRIAAGGAKAGGGAESGGGAKAGGTSNPGGDLP
jgi:Zn-dependent protease/CBS domain-containing protein